MSQLIKDFKINTNGDQSIVVESSVIRSEKWLITMDSIENGFYGYGYGPEAFFQTPLTESPNSLDYFHVLGLDGQQYGYGIDGTQGDGFDSYSYGWGYEFANAVVSDGEDSIVISALVTEDGTPVEGKEVVFQPSQGVSLSVNTCVTDEYGYAYTIATMDDSLSYIKLLDSPQNTYRSLSSFASLSISKLGLLVITLPSGFDPDSKGIVASTFSEDLVDYKVSVSNTGYIDGNYLNILSLDKNGGSNYQIVYNEPENAIDIGSSTVLGKVEIYKKEDERQFSESFPANGYFFVKAFINDGPQLNEGMVVTQTSSNQLFVSDSEFILTFSNQSLQHFSYGYDTFI